MLYVWVTGVMDVVFSVCIMWVLVYGKYECFVALSTSSHRIDKIVK